MSTALRAVCIRFLDQGQAGGILKAREFSISKLNFTQPARIGGEQIDSKQNFTKRIYAH